MKKDSHRQTWRVYWRPNRQSNNTYNKML